MGYKQEQSTWTGNTISVDEPTDVTPSGVKFIDIAVGEEFALAVASDGTVYSTGLNDCSQLGVASTAISAQTSFVRLTD